MALRRQLVRDGASKDPFLLTVLLLIKLYHSLTEDD